MSSEDGETHQPAGVVRVTTFRAKTGQTSQLLAAAESNARDTRAATGCRSAEVCLAQGDPETVIVISRWDSAKSVQSFLDWHERLAHGVVSPHATGKPHSAHYLVVASQ